MKQKSTNVKLTLQLKPEERKIVDDILNKGSDFIRVIKRARVLQLFDDGHASPTVAEYVGVTPETARRIGWNYVNEGFKRALYDGPRPGRGKKLSYNEETRIVALVCSDPPAGYQRWSVRLLTEEVIKRKIVNSIGRETVRIILKSHGLKPWREKNVVCRRT